MSKELKICPGVGARKCGAFLARLDRDPHPTCTRCRGKVCTRDMTCDFCAVWSAEQWELFAKKRSYKERKHHPSGSAPSAQQTTPRAETSSGVSRPGTSSSSSSRLNAKLPLYCSLVPDPQAVFEDAFRHPWDDLDLYAFPPFALVGRVIAHVQQSS